jgi:hypothetical protein
MPRNAVAGRLPVGPPGGQPDLTAPTPSCPGGRPPLFAGRFAIEASWADGGEGTAATARPAPGERRLRSSTRRAVWSSRFMATSYDSAPSPTPPSLRRRHPERRELSSYDSPRGRFRRRSSCVTVDRRRCAADDRGGAVRSGARRDRERCRRICPRAFGNDSRVSHGSGGKRRPARLDDTPLPPDGRFGVRSSRRRQARNASPLAMASGIVSLDGPRVRHAIRMVDGRAQRQLGARRRARRPAAIVEVTVSRRPRRRFALGGDAPTSRPRSTPSVPRRHGAGDAGPQPGCDPGDGPRGRSSHRCAGTRYALAIPKRPDALTEVTLTPVTAIAGLPREAAGGDPHRAGGIATGG